MTANCVTLLVTRNKVQALCGLSGRKNKAKQWRALTWRKPFFPFSILQKAEVSIRSTAFTLSKSAMTLSECWASTIRQPGLKGPSDKELSLGWTQLLPFFLPSPQSMLKSTCSRGAPCRYWQNRKNCSSLSKGYTYNNMKRKQQNHRKDSVIPQTLWHFTEKQWKKAQHRSIHKHNCNHFKTWCLL